MVSRIAIIFSHVVLKLWQIFIKRPVDLLHQNAHSPKTLIPEMLDLTQSVFWRIQIPGSIYARVLFFKEFVLFACDELVAWVDRWIRSWWSKKGWQIAMYLRELRNAFNVKYSTRNYIIQNKTRSILKVSS